MTMYRVGPITGGIASSLLSGVCCSGQLESLNDRSKTFFTLCRKNNKPELREQQYQNLCQVTARLSLGTYLSSVYTCGHTGV